MNHIGFKSLSLVYSHHLIPSSTGTLLYNGPIVIPDTEEIIVSDFISLELERGYPRLLIDFGSGTLELRVKTKKTLVDGEWHQIDIFWDNEVIIIPCP